MIELKAAEGCSRNDWQKLKKQVKEEEEETKRNAISNWDKCEKWLKEVREATKDLHDAWKDVGKWSKRCVRSNWAIW
jgi:hypothetical protein